MQLEEINNFLSDFETHSKSEIKLVTICGDLNLDLKSDYDKPCKNSKIFMGFTDTMNKSNVGTCMIEEKCRHPDVSTPRGLQKAMQVN